MITSAFSVAVRRNMKSWGKRARFRFAAWLRTRVETPYNAARSASSITRYPRIDRITPPRLSSALTRWLQALVDPQSRWSVTRKTSGTVMMFCISHHRPSVPGRPPGPGIKVAICDLRRIASFVVSGNRTPEQALAPDAKRPWATHWSRRAVMVQHQKAHRPPPLSPSRHG